MLSLEALEESNPETRDRATDGGATTVGIINYNGRAYLEGTLAAVRKLGSGIGEVLVVDGGSNDGSIELLGRLTPAIRLVDLQGNPGPGIARNVAIRAARHGRVLLLDNDVAPEPGCLNALSAALDANHAALLAMPAILDAQVPNRVQYLGANPHFLGTQSLLSRNTTVEALDGVVRAVASVVTACMLVDRSRFGARPWFDERLFLYFEDHEFGLRAALQGFDLLTVPGAHCLHGLGSVGISIRETGRFTPIRIRYTIRNRWLTILMLYQPGTLVRLAPGLAAFEFFQCLGAVSKGWLTHWLWAVGSARRSLPYIRQKRRALRCFRQRRDLEVLVGGPFPYNPAMHQSAVSHAAARLLDRIADLNWRRVRKPATRA